MLGPSDRVLLSNRDEIHATSGALVSGRNSGAAIPFAGFTAIALWIIVASGWFVMIEPAPYDMLMLGLAGLLFIAGLRVPSGLGSTILLAAVFIVANIVSIIVARESVSQPIAAITFYAGLTVYFLLSYVFIAALVAESGGSLLDVIWNAWIVAAVIAAALAVLAFFSVIPGSEQFMKFGRAKSAFKDPNVFGPFLIPAVLIMLSRLNYVGIGRKLLYFSLIMLLVFGIFLSFSRGAWANLVLSFFVFACLRLATFRSAKQFMAAAMVVSLILMSALVMLSLAKSNPELSQMIDRRASLLHSYDTESGGRFSVQREALTIIAKVPLGVGSNRSATQFGMNPHNVYIKIFLENGWLGGISFLVMLAVIMMRGFQSAMTEGPIRDDAIVIFACLTGVIGESMIIDTLHWRHLFLLLGMMSGASILMHRQRLYQPYNTRGPDIRVQQPLSARASN